MLAELCERALAWNIARPDTAIAVEQSIVEGTRSDVVIDRGPKGPLIVEVVVAHDIEEPTRARYERSGIPVFIIYPEWDTVAELTWAVNAAALINVSAVRCRECQDSLDRSLKERSAARTWALCMLSGATGDTTALCALCGFSDVSDPPLEVRQVRARDVRRRSDEKSTAAPTFCGRMGFVQTAGKPWLFRFQLPQDCGVVFANFGSTEEVALWEDPSALIHWQLRKRSDEEEAALVKQLLQRCRSAGAKVRVSFYHQHLDQ